MPTDAALLEQFLANRSPEAFREIVQRYSGLVYGVALRMTADRAAAEDICQDCFFALSQKVNQVRQSLPGWLHQAALNGAHQFNRSETARKQRERSREQPAAHEHNELTWELS